MEARCGDLCVVCVLGQGAISDLQLVTRLLIYISHLKPNKKIDAFAHIHSGIVF